MFAEPHESLADILRRHAATTPDKTFIIHEDRRVSYAETLAAIAHLAALFAELGTRKGDLVGVFMDKTPEAIEAFLAATACGAVFFPLDFHQPPQALRAMLDALSPKVVTAADKYLPTLAAIYPEGPPFSLVGMDGKETPNVIPFAPDFSSSPALPAQKAEKNNPVYLNFTSGTTGENKGAVTTQGNLYWNTRAACEALCMDANDIHLCMMPIFVHPHELFARPLYLGGTMVLTDNISPKNVAALITRHKVSCFMAVASIYETLVRLGDLSAYDFSGLRVPESGGMHVTAALVDALAQRFGARLLPVWGSTETAGIALATPVGEAYRPGSSGKILPHYHVHIETPDGAEAKPNEEGELVVSGPGVCPGYFGRKTAPGEALHGHRFATGDLFRRDEDGFYYFLGRRYHLMKVGGMKVYPAEVEEALRSIDAIAEAVVIPVKDALRGEAPKAVIALKDGCSLSQAELRRRLEGLLHRHKIPRHIEFVSELPRTPGGKIAWRKLS
jgi:long-chain acyl-CoA synthetase